MLSAHVLTTLTRRVKEQAEHLKSAVSEALHRTESLTAKNGQLAVSDLENKHSLTDQELADIAKFHGTRAANWVTDTKNYSFLLRISECHWELFVDEIRKHFGGAGIAHEVEPGLLRFTLSKEPFSSDHP